MLYLSCFRTWAQRCGRPKVKQATGHDDMLAFIAQAVLHYITQNRTLTGRTAAAAAAKSLQSCPRPTLQL